jgi:hypothetical protein
MKSSPGAASEWNSTGNQIRRTDSPSTESEESKSEESKVTERDNASELRSRLLRMILDNEQQRKSLISSTPIPHNQFDA